MKRKVSVVSGYDSTTALFGSSLEKCDVSTFVLSERRYPPHFQTPAHAHETSLFCLVLDGSYTETSGGRQQICQPSTFLFHEAGDRHAEQFHDKGGHSFIVEIPSVRVAELTGSSNLVICTSLFRNGNLPILAKKLYREFKRFDNFSPLIMEGLVFEIIGEVSRQSNGARSDRCPSWLKSVEEYIKDHFEDRLTLPELAAVINVHPVHLAQTFRRHYNTTIGSYLRRLRLERSREQLLSTNKTLAEIACGNGFSDQSHFTRLFKREFGQTPHAYRQN